MQKTILITGSTDGIGLETAKMLVSEGHHVLIHGRNQAKLEQAAQLLSDLNAKGKVECYIADLSCLTEVKKLAKCVTEKHDKLDVLINNAGVYKTPERITAAGLDVRFVVNTIAPYLLTQELLPLMDSNARVISLSSAAQASVDPEALAGKVKLADDLEVYSQSKLALTMWSRHMALSLKNNGPVFIAVNPGSLLATKMVKEGFGMEGNDISIGAKILVRLALEDEFETASGKYFDNDHGRLSSPHQDALNLQKSEAIVHTIENILDDI